MKQRVKEELISKFDFECSCGCGELQFSQWKDDGISFISYVLPAFYAYQYGTIDRIKKAFKIFWELVIMGREFQLYEIVIDDNKKLKQFKEFVAAMREIDESQ